MSTNSLLNWVVGQCNEYIIRHGTPRRLPTIRVLNSFQQTAQHHRQQQLLQTFVKNTAFASPSCNQRTWLELFLFSHFPPPIEVGCPAASFPRQRLLWIRRWIFFCFSCFNGSTVTNVSKHSTFKSNASHQAFINSNERAISLNDPLEVVSTTPLSTRFVCRFLFHSV